jgi:hypothetical protein
LPNYFLPSDFKSGFSGAEDTDIFSGDRDREVKTP